MEDILRKLTEHAAWRVAEDKKRISFEEMRRLAESKTKGTHPFYKAIAKDGISFICEVKKASPSKGIIAEDFPYKTIAKEYEAAGADAISVLTEPKWFLGSKDYLEEISKDCNTPLLRKDFTVDPYMIYEAKVIGASAVLLIVSILKKDKLKEYLTICKELEIDALVEAHDENEIEVALSVDADIIGVNNRNLKDFSVDTDNAKRLRELVPKDRLFVSESGIWNKSDVKAAKESGADAVLIGEALMRALDKKEFLSELRR